jgi:dihydrofolate reductase
MTKRRNVIVHIAASADGYIARPDGDLAWLTSRPAPDGFYGMEAFVRSIDTKLLGRKTYEVSRRMGRRSTRRVGPSSSPATRRRPTPRQAWSS